MRALIVPGNDLDAPFYDGLVAALGRRGVQAEALTLPGWAGVAPLAERGWRGLVAHVREKYERSFSREVPARTGEGGTLIGHSLGALTALLVAAERPAGLARLVLLEPVIAPWRRLAAALAKAYLKEVVLSHERSFLNGGVGFRRVADLARYPGAAIERYERVRATSDRATAEALFRELPGLYPLPLGRVEVPVLLVRGARSGLFPRLAQWGLARGLRRAGDAGGSRRVERVVLPGTGHWVANEADEAAAEAIAGFIGGSGDGRPESRDATGGPS